MDTDKRGRVGLRISLSVVRGLASFAYAMRSSMGIVARPTCPTFL